MPQLPQLLRPTEAWLSARRASVDAWLAGRRASVDAWLAGRRAWWERYRDAHSSSPVCRYLAAHLAMVTSWFELQPLAGVTRWLDARRESSKGVTRALWSLARQMRFALPTLAAVALVVFAMGGRWRLAGASPSTPTPTLPAPQSTSLPSTSPTSATSPSQSPTSATSPSQSPTSATPPSPSPSPGAASLLGGARPWKKPAVALTGKLNLNTATEEQLMLLPTVGPAKAERITKWRTMNGGFRRIADIRRVKGFGYKTFKRLEAFLEVAGETTLH